MIPKKIHYCWFGGNKKPEIIENCIASWRKYCPDYEIIEWNESNYDVSANIYAKEAYEAKQWAFVSDVARVDIIYKYGGIYMDTDVELAGSLDVWLTKDVFLVWETELNINSGCGFGAAEKHPAIKAMLDYYENKHFTINGKNDYSPCPAANTAAVRSIYPNIVRNGQTQIVDDILIISYGDYTKIAKHYGTALWGEGPYDNKERHVYKNTKLKQWLKKPEKFSFIQKHFGEKGLKIYTFLVYDIPERGIGYFVKRFVWKKFKKNK